MKTTKKLNTCTVIENNVEEKQTYIISRVIKKGLLEEAIFKQT